jgi:hypothetical protein
LVQILRNPRTWAHLLEPELVKLLGDIHLVLTKNKLQKQKSFLRVGMGDSERREEGSCMLQSQEGQELREAAAAKRLITQKSSVSQSVDLTTKDMGNHYLRDVHHAFTLHCPQEDRIFDIHDQIEM